MMSETLEEVENKKNEELDLKYREEAEFEFGHNNPHCDEEKCYCGKWSNKGRGLVKQKVDIERVHENRLWLQKEL